MPDILALAPLLGGLGSFAFACVMCFAMMQHMRQQADKMLDIMSTSGKEGTAAICGLTTAVAQLNVTNENLSRLVLERTR